MKTLISIIFLVLMTSSLSGCTIVNRHSRHRETHREVIVTKPAKSHHPEPRKHSDAKGRKPRDEHPDAKKREPGDEHHEPDHKHP